MSAPRMLNRKCKRFNPGEWNGASRMRRRKKPAHTTLPYKLYFRDMQPVIRRQTISLNWMLFAR